MEGHIGLTLGVDEAGRGAQIGPLVLAAVALTPPEALQLLDLGLHDSKRLTTTARARLAATVRSIATWTSTAASSARTVDRYIGTGARRRRRTLNVLEPRRGASALNEDVLLEIFIEIQKSPALSKLHELAIAAPPASGLTPEARWQVVHQRIERFTKRFVGMQFARRGDVAARLGLL